MIDTSNFLKLLELVKQNPEMPVFPIVSENICDSVDFGGDFTLCHFEEPYIIGFCEYILYDRLQFITEWEKDFITEDVIRKNQGKLPEWKTGIFVPISGHFAPIKSMEKHPVRQKNISNVGGHVSGCCYSCERSRYGECCHSSYRCTRKSLPYSMTIGINDGYSE